MQTTDSGAVNLLNPSLSQRELDHLHCGGVTTLCNRQIVCRPIIRLRGGKSPTCTMGLYW